jgi:hypothetical protein
MKTYNGGKPPVILNLATTKLERSASFNGRYTLRDGAPVFHFVVVFWFSELIW